MMLCPGSAAAGWNDPRPSTTRTSQSSIGRGRDGPTAAVKGDVEHLPLLVVLGPAPVGQAVRKLAFLPHIAAVAKILDVPPVRNASGVELGPLLHAAEHPHHALLN